MTQDDTPPEEAAGQVPARRQAIRDRQMRIGGNLATTAYNRLLALLQEDQPLTADQLARLIEVGTRIEGRAYAELPLEFDPDGDIDRILQARDFDDKV